METHQKAPLASKRLSALIGVDVRVTAMMSGTARHSVTDLHW